MWTIWTAAPVTADAAITSPTDSMLEPGSRRPELRTWTNTGTRRRRRRERPRSSPRASPPACRPGPCRSERAGVELVLEPAQQRLPLASPATVSVPRLARRHDRVRRAGAAERAHARPGMARGGPEVDRRRAAPRVVERRDVRRADLEIERGRHPFLRREAIRRGVVDVRVQVDEPRRHDQAARVDRGRPVSGSADTAAMRPPVMPTSRTASSPVSGSMTRPPRITEIERRRLARRRAARDPHDRQPIGLSPSSVGAACEPPMHS